MKFFFFIILLLIYPIAKADSLHIPKNCYDLSKPEQAEDLLYQFYRNKDTNCLFVIDVDVLENIWKIPIMDFRDTSKQTREEISRRFDHLDSYSELGKKIRITISTSKYGQHFRVSQPTGDSFSLFEPDSSFPRQLPKPKGFYSHWTAIGAPWIKDKDYGDYKAYHVYAWHGQYANIYLENNNNQRGVYGFIFTDHLRYPKRNF